MTLNLSMPGHDELKPRITVFGVGGAGGNAVNNMIEKQLEGVEFVVANTDAQALQQAQATNRIQLGVKVTEGLGAGAKASVGAAAAEESIEQIVDHLAGAHMCFITAGMGGGTGTGAAPIIAQAARELGVLTVGVVTKPFQFEGGKRMRQAEEGVEALQKVVDTLIIIPNQNLFRLATEKTTFTEAFSLADDVLYQGVKGVTDLMVCPGLINLDFADVRAVMDEMGKAMMGTGEATGEDRAIQAAEKAIANPLLDEISLRGAKGVLINITGGHDLTLFELDEAANRIREEVDPDANIIVGSTLDTSLEGGMRVSVVATGIDASAKALEEPAPRRTLAEPLTQQVSAEQPAPAPQQPAPQAPTAAAPQPQYQQPQYQQPAPQQPTSYQTPAPQQPKRPAPLPQESYQQPTQQPRIAAPQYPAEDVPAPAYQPRAEEYQQPAPEAHQGDDFVAPQRPVAGAASPETMARLKAAVNHSGTQQQRPMGSTQPQAPARPAAPAAPEKSRFGINSLINRMTGHNEQPAAPARPQPQPERNAPQTARRVAPPAPSFEEDVDNDPAQDKIEIPAFLRRQAN